MSEAEDGGSTTARPRNVTLPRVPSDLSPAARAAALLGEASDAHGWRARSFAGAFRAIAASEGVSPDDLGALAEALSEHVEGLAAAVNEAHDLLSGRAAA